jgi:hypothetical protein
MKRRRCADCRQEGRGTDLEGCQLRSPMRRVHRASKEIVTNVRRRGSFPSPPPHWVKTHLPGTCYVNLWLCGLVGNVGDPVAVGRNSISLEIRLRRRRLRGCCWLAVPISLTVSRAKPLRRRPKGRLDICHRATNPGSDRCSVRRITFTAASAALERSSTLPPPVVTGTENTMILASGAFCSVH